MKKVLLLMSLSVSLTAKAQNLTIPDANFKNALVNTLCVDTNNDLLGDADADTNNDGEIQLSEAQAATYLFLGNQNIADLSGIENFVNLTFLSCRVNQLTSLDVSALTNLEQLYCYRNQLTSLDIHTCTQLQVLHCYRNQLTSLDLQNFPNLEGVICNTNLITSLDVHGLTHLTLLNCYTNQLTSINLAGATGLSDFDCHLNQLTTINAEDCLALGGIRCDDNPLTSLFIKNGSTEPGSISFTNCPSLSYICCDSNQIAAVQSIATQNGLFNCAVNSDCGLAGNNELATSHELNVFPNPTDALLNIATELSINRVDIYDINGRLIQSRLISANQVDVKSLESGVYFLRLYGADSVYYSKFIKQ